MIRIFFLMVLFAFAAYLFNRFVQPQQRQLLLKGLLIGAGAILLLLIIFLVWTNYEEQALKDSISIRYQSFEQGEADATISFEICNQRDIPLINVRFFVSGFQAGRSSPHAIVNSRQASGSSSELKTDLIIQANDCQTERWQGNYLAFDRYEIANILAIWQDSKRVVIP